MARGQPAPLAQINSAEGKQTPAKRPSSRSGRGRKPHDGQSSYSSDAVIDSSAVAAAVAGKDRPASAQKGSRATYVPITLQPSAGVESSRSKDTQLQRNMPAKQPASNRRSPRAAELGESNTDSPRQRPGGRHGRGNRQRQREKAQRQARQEAAQNEQGQRGGGTAPDSEHAGSQGKGSSADCPVCWGECPHSDERCPCLDHLPDGLLAEVWDLIEENQRHYALTIMQRYWDRIDLSPPCVPLISRVRGRVFCYFCDSQDHSAERCPDLSKMDKDTWTCLMAAYKYGSCNGRTPGEIYTEWEDGVECPEMPPCLVCKSTAHGFEACPSTPHFQQDSFQKIVAALRAGQPQPAQEIWDTFRAGRKQSRARKGGRSGGRAGDNVAERSQSDRGMPEVAVSEQQAPLEIFPSSSLTSREDSRGTAQSCAVSSSLWADVVGTSKPYWHEEMAAKAATQGALRGMPSADRQPPPEKVPAVAASAAEQAGPPQQAPQAASQHLLQPINLEELESKLRLAELPKHSHGLPPMPQQPEPALGLHPEQMQHSLAPRTMLVTPLAPSARRASASTQSSTLSSTVSHRDTKQAGASGQLSRPSSAAQLGNPGQLGGFEQPICQDRAGEPAPHPLPSAQHLPSLHSVQLNAQRLAIQPASVGIPWHLQNYYEASAQQDAGAAAWDRDIQPGLVPDMSTQHTGGTAGMLQNMGMSQERPLQNEQAEQRTHSQHTHYAAGLAEQQQPRVSSLGAPAASYASHAIAVGIPAAHMHGMRNVQTTGNPAYTGIPSMGMNGAAACTTDQTLLQLPLSEQQDALRQQHHHHEGQLVALNHLRGMPAPMPAAQWPAGSQAQPQPVSTADSQHVHARTDAVASMAPRRARAPPAFLGASPAVPRPLQEELLQLQAPERFEDQGWAADVHHMQQSLSHTQDSPLPWLPSAPANGGPHGAAPDFRLPAPGSMQHSWPPPQTEPYGGHQGPLLVSQAQLPPEQVPPVQQPGFAEALTAQWDMHSSSSSSVAASPARPKSTLHPARTARPPRRPAPMSSAASEASAQQQQQQHSEDSHKDIMALLLHGVHHAAKHPKKSSHERSDCPASPGLSEPPRRSLSSSPDPEAEAEAGMKGAWGKPLSTAVRAAPQPSTQLASPSRPKAASAKPAPAPAAVPAQAEPAAMPQPVTPATEAHAASPAQAKSWTRVGKHSKGETNKGVAAEVAKKERLQASHPSADSADDKNLEKAIKESLKMQAAGKRRQAVGAVSCSAQSEADLAAGPGLQNDPGDYNCFLNVIVQCLWHCAAFRDAFLSLPRKVVQADEALSELSTLFKGFGKPTSGNMGKRTLDPTGLRLALAKLNPKRFAAGEMSDAAEVLNVVSERLDLTEEGRSMAQAVWGCHVREQMHCLRCGRDTRQKSYCQYLFTASASGLREQASVMCHGDEGDQAPVVGSAVIRELEKRTTIKSCSMDEGGCGRRGPMQQFLEGRQPRAFALQLVWESLQETGQDIRDTLELVQEGIDLGKIYLGTEAGKRQYQPCIMVCYYGRHYHAFVHMDGQWRGFDDAASYAVGSWAELVHKCELGKIQPSVLFFKPT